MKLTRTRSFRVDASPEVVFDALADVAAFAARFPPPDRSVPGGIDPAPLAPGSRVRWFDVDTGRVVRTSLAIEVDRPHRLVFDAEPGEGSKVRIGGRTETRIEGLATGGSMVRESYDLLVPTVAAFTIAIFSPIMWWPNRRRRAELVRWIEHRARGAGG